MRRLSVIDLESGRQPVQNEDGKVWVVSNSEIYNYRELRKQLKKAGHQFRTESDTEVIVHAYEEFGEAFAESLDGMFAIAVWDDRCQRLILARDHLGIKPLYYYTDNRVLAFASELRALTALDQVPRELDLLGLDELLTLGYTTGARTLLANIRKLRPAHYLVDEGGEVRERHYWRPRVREKAWSQAEACEVLRATMTEAVRKRLLSDVPVGAFLSGGVDSSIVVGLMSKLKSEPVTTFSVAFADGSYNESGYAHLVSEHFGTRHHEFPLRIEPSDLLGEMTASMDQPIPDFAFVPTMLLSRMAREEVKVCLSGDGSDELFGGYDTYLSDKIGRWAERGLTRPGLQRLLRYASLFRPTPKKTGWVNRLKSFADGMEFPDGTEHYRWMMLLSPQMRQGLYTDHLREALMDCSPFRRVLEQFSAADFRWGRFTRQSFVDLNVYLADDILPKIDIAGMSNGLEVRVPFLDRRLVEMGLSFPDRYKIRGFRRKHILKEAFRDLVPRAVRRRAKEGFSIPMKNWLRQELRGVMLEVLDRKKVREMGLFRWHALSGLVQQHLSGNQDYSRQLWCLMLFHLWYERTSAALPLTKNPAALSDVRASLP